MFKVVQVLRDRREPVGQHFPRDRQARARHDEVELGMAEAREPPRAEPRAVLEAPWGARVEADGVVEMPKAEQEEARARQNVTDEGAHLLVDTKPVRDLSEEHFAKNELRRVSNTRRHRNLFLDGLIFLQILLRPNSTLNV